MEKIKIPAIIGDPSIMFTGTDDEIEEFENQEENCKNAWRVLVEKFTAFEFRKGIHHIIFPDVLITMENLDFPFSGMEKLNAATFTTRFP